MGDFGETVHIVSFQNDWFQADLPFDCNMAIGKRTYQRLDLVLCAGDSHVRVVDLKVLAQWKLHE